MMPSSFQIDLDEITLRRACKGNRGACEQIYRLFQRPAYTLAYRICQCPEMAQDIVQDAFITLFRRIGQFRGDSPFWGWLRKVVVNQALTALRRKPRELGLELAPEPASGPEAHQRIQDTLDANWLLAQLSDEDRAVVWLHDVEGYNHREIGHLMNKTESYSKTRLSRARKSLQEYLRNTNDYRDAAVAESLQAG